jgi:hypothetical protein
MSELAKSCSGFGIVSPVSGGFISAGTHLYDRKAAMRYAVKLCTVYGGQERGETWRGLYRKGYRIVRVRITPSAQRASQERSDG